MSKKNKTDFVSPITGTYPKMTPKKLWRFVVLAVMFMLGAAAGSAIAYYFL